MDQFTQDLIRWQLPVDPDPKDGMVVLDLLTRIAFQIDIVIDLKKHRAISFEQMHDG